MAPGARGVGDLSQVAAETPQLVVSDSVIWLSVSCSLRPPARAGSGSGVGHLVVSGSVIWLSAGRVGRKVPGPWMGQAARRSCDAWPPWRTRAGGLGPRSGQQPARWGSQSRRCGGGVGQARAGEGLDRPSQRVLDVLSGPELDAPLVTARTPPPPPCSTCRPPHGPLLPGRTPLQPLLPRPPPGRAAVRRDTAQ